MTPEQKTRKKSLLLAKKAILESRDDLLTFAKYMRPDMKAQDDASRSAYIVGKHHAYIGEQLERLERGDIKRLIISCPPRHGKSELALKTFVPWVMGRNPSWHVISATYNSTFAEDFGRSVRDIVQDPRYSRVFPQTKLKDGAQSVSRLETTDQAQAHFVGRGGSLTGRGGHLIAVDDPYKDRVEADSPTTRNSLWSWWTQVLSTRLMTDDGRILIIMTRWHDDDIVGRLTDPNNSFYNKQEAAKWEVINLPAIAEPDDPLGRKPNEPLWPERFSTTFLASVRNQDPRGFSALYQGQPAPADGLFFGPEDIVEFQRMSEFPEDCVMYSTSDHAVSTNQWADKSAFIVFGVDKNEDIWIHPDTVLKKIGSQEAVDTMLRLMQQHNPLYWWAETGHISKSIGPFLRKRMLEEKVYCSLVELTPVKDKQTRAQSIKGRMAMKKVHFPAWARWWEEARNQILTFPAGAKDDFVDALAMIGLGLALQHRPRSFTPKKKTVEGSFGEMLQTSNADRKRNRMIDMNKGW